jgi:hypothetical protein
MSRDNFVAEPMPMKSLLSILLLTGFVLAACEEEPPPRAHQRVARYPVTEPAPYPPEQQPFNPNAPGAATPAPETAPAMPTPTAAPPTRGAARGDHPYGIPVPGKPHVVESPFSPGKYVDVEGFPPGTEVKDPYTGKIFLVP